MSLVLNTNVDALVAQNGLSASGNQLSTSLQQLSTGLRINTAADDAAGYAIVQGMTSQIGGLNQAAQNANDGVSLVQTAAGALQEITNDLQSMRDLAVESLNASNSSTDRTDLNTQFQQLLSDINQVSQSTNFNGVNLLDGTFQGATFQVGADAGQTITVSAVANQEASNLAQLYSAAAGTYANSATALTGTITVATTANGVTSTATTLPVTVGGPNSTATTDLATVANAINALSNEDGGVIATVAGPAAAPTGIVLNTTSGTAAAPPTIAVTFGGTLTTGATGVAAANTTAANANVGMTATDVLTVNDSNLALQQIDTALQSVATTSATLGAYQNRFSAAITGLNTDSTNLTSARSGIADTDYAAATSKLSQAQILQQASTAMVAQANTIPQNVLTLLQKLP
jgi:flagellin